MSGLKSKAISGVKWTAIGTMGRSLFQLLQVAVLARYLSKEAFGLVAMAILVVQFTNIFVDMGMSSAILHRQNATRKEYSSIYWLNIFISLSLYIFVFAITPFIASFYNEPELNTLVPILGVNVLIIASGRQHRTIMQRRFEFKAISIIELISYGSGLVSAVVLAIAGYGVYSLVYSTLLSSFVSNSLFFFKNIQKNPISFHFRLSETKPFLKIGGFTMGSTLLDFFSREIDIIVIGRLLGAESVGVYSLAKQIILKLYNVINPIVTSVLSPLLASIQSEKDRLKKSYLKTVKYLAYINVPLYMFVILSSKDILSLLYGSNYADAYLVLSFMAFSYFLVSIGNPVGSLQIATGRTDIGFKWTIFRLLVTPPVIFLGALYSIEMVAGLYAFLMLLFIIPSWYMLLKTMANIELREYLKQFYKPLILALIILLISFFLNSISISNMIIADIVIKFLAVLSVYLFFIFTFEKKLALEIINLVLEQIKKLKYIKQRECPFFY